MFFVIGQLNGFVALNWPRPKIVAWVASIEEAQGWYEEEECYQKVTRPQLEDRASTLERARL
jgi:hypothetical protein